MDKQVIIPKYLRESVNPLKGIYPKNVNLMVFDVETEQGKPYFLILYDGNKITYHKVTPEDVLEVPSVPE